MKAELGTLEDLRALAVNCQYSSSQMAEALGLSERQFRRRFRAQYHVSPGKWCRELRLMRAAEGQASNVFLKDIAKNLGYEHASNLIRALSRNKQRICQ